MPFNFGLPQLLGLWIIAALLVPKFTNLTTSEVLLWLSLIVAPLYLILYRSYLYPYYVSELRHVPTVQGFPLWGHFFTIITTEVGVPQRQWHIDHGPIVRYFFLFGAERLSVADDEALHHILVKNAYNYRKPSPVKKWMVRILGEGVLLAEGSEHVHQRKALAPGFSIASIRALMPVFWQKSLLLSRLLKAEMVQECATIKSFEVLDWLNRTTLDIIGEAGFGTKINSLENPTAPLREAYRLVFASDLVARILHGVQVYIPSARYIPAKMNCDMDNARRIILQKATDIIIEKEGQAAAHTKHKDILALISQDNLKMKLAGQPGLSFQTMRDQIMTFLGAGHDTTATGVAWTLHLLAKYPHVQSRLRKEVQRHMSFLSDPATRHNKELLSIVDVDKLPYLHNVCRESLRFIPTVPTTVRQAIAHDTFGGYGIPSGTKIYILANTINRLPLYWGPTANDFDPDRWTKLPPTYRSNAFMTFLHGPRGCIGRKFAEIEMKVLLCCLLSMYVFYPDTSRDDPEDEKMWRLVLRPKDGIHLRLAFI